MNLDDPQAMREADAALIDAGLRRMRERTLASFDALSDALGGRLHVERRDEVNLPLWELGHQGWFEEWWIARNPQRARGAAARPDVPRGAPLLPGADALYDSSAVAHARRWQLPLPDARRTRALLASQRERTRALLHGSAADDAALYFFRLVLHHEAMHHEAGLMVAQGLGLAVPAPPLPPLGSGELAVDATRLRAGEPAGGFAFDNELGPHDVAIEPFRIDAAPVAWRAVVPFIDAGGYDTASAWTPAGWAWRRQALPHGLPRMLSRAEDGRLLQRHFGATAPLDLDAPAIHLSAHEAQAWCRWAGRRLPTEHEWVHAQATHGRAFEHGQVWEWTASRFEPFPGFVAHPYRDYSQPWFDSRPLRPVLKGGSFATEPFMKHPHYRNFFEPHRHDVFAGFRSCAT
jgi:iron(II)-dependent oxidoreductase